MVGYHKNQTITYLFKNKTKNKMRKAILAFGLIVTLASCNGTSKQTEASTTDSTAVAVDSVSTSVDTTQVDSVTTK